MSTYHSDFDINELIVPCIAAVQQVKPEFEGPLAWRYPDPPAEVEPRHPPDFELKIPESALSVGAVCGESSVRVEARKDLLRIGKPAPAADVTLGGCAATGEDAHIFIFESELHGCGSQLLVGIQSRLLFSTFL